MALPLSLSLSLKRLSLINRKWLSSHKIQLPRSFTAPFRTRGDSGVGTRVNKNLFEGKKLYFFVKNGHRQPLFWLFWSFQTNTTNFTANRCEKFSSSIWCWDSNPRPSGHESPSITTRPGLHPKSYFFNDKTYERKQKIYVLAILLHLHIFELFFL